MRALPRALGVSLIAVSSLVVATCASMQVESYLSRDAEFGRYRSYAWAASDRLSTGDPRLDNNPFFLERLRSQVDHQLAAKGFTQRETPSPDLIVHYHASVRDQIDLNGIDAEYERCETGDCHPFAYQAGTIVLDLVDSRTNRLVWRGWATDSLEGVIDNQDWLEQKVDRAVLRIMERLPRSPLAAPRS
jgi:hypothetical protein